MNGDPEDLDDLAEKTRLDDIVLAVEQRRLDWAHDVFELGVCVLRRDRSPEVLAIARQLRSSSGIGRFAHCGDEVPEWIRSALSTAFSFAGLVLHEEAIDYEYTGETLIRSSHLLAAPSPELEARVRAIMADRAGVLAAKSADSQVSSTGRLMSMKEAAKEAGIKLERLRGWCRRARNPLKRHEQGGTFLVDLHDVLRERDAKNSKESGTRLDPIAPAIHPPPGGKKRNR